MIKGSTIDIFNLFFNEADGLYCIADNGGQLINANNRFCDFFELDCNETNKLNIKDFVNQTEHISFQEAINSGIESFNFSSRVKIKSQTYHWIEWRFKKYQNYYFIHVQDISLQKSSEDMLSMFKNSTEYAQDAIYWIKEDGYIEYANKKARELLGYNSCEIIQLNVCDFIIGETMESYKLKWLTKTETSTNNDNRFESKHRCKNGEEVPLEVTSNFILGNEHWYYMISARDISIRKKVEQDLLVNQKLLTETQRIAQMGSWELDLASNTFLWTKQTYSIFKIDDTNAPLTFDLFIKLVYLPDREKISSLLKTAMDTKIINPFEYRIVTKDHQILTLHTEGEVILNDKGEAVKMIGSVKDITEQNKIETALKESEEKARLFIENTPLPIAMFDTNMCYLMASKRWYSDYKLGDKKIIGLSHYEVFPEIPERWKDDHRRVLNGEVYSNDADVFIREDGSLQWLRYELRPWYNALGEVGGIVMFTEDITLRKNMEQDLISALTKAKQSELLKDAFLHNLSHEIRTPLNAIVGFSDILIDNFDGNPGIKKYTQLIKDGSDQLLNIVTDTITMASIQTGHEKVKLSYLPIKKIMNELYNRYLSFAEQNGLSLITTIPGSFDDVLLELDEYKTTYILSKLVDNSIKFTKSGFVKVGCDLDKDKIIFHVEDSGIGIDEKYHDIIFDRFQQANDKIHINYGGTGLGLSITKSFVDMLDGEITLKSVLHQGSTFFITLPIKIMEVETKKETVTNSLEFINQPLNILIAEDEYSNFLFLKYIFSGYPANVVHAENGARAVEIMQGAQSFDLILMDIRMPEMDGVTAFKEIRKFNQQIPVIAQTAYTFIDEDTKIEEVGFSDYLFKPINKQELLQKISNLIGLQKEAT